MDPKQSALKRIKKDLKENALQPIEGVKVLIPDNELDFFNLHCDVNILYGIYQGIKIHLIIHIPYEYPLIGPAINIASNLHLPENFHANIQRKSLCSDLLINYSKYLYYKNKGLDVYKPNGWMSSYTLNVVLSQLQMFFADPLLPDDQIVSQEQIENLKEFSTTKYQCRECRACKNKYALDVNNQRRYNLDSDEVNGAQDEYKKRLICGNSKNSLCNDPTIILGYPLMIKLNQYGDIIVEPLPELLSYDSYINQLKYLGIKNSENVEGINMTTPKGNTYNYWIPCYLNEDHFQRSYQFLHRSILNIYNVIYDENNSNLILKMVAEVLTHIINKVVPLMMNPTTCIAEAAIQAYCHFVRLYYRFIKHKPDLKDVINNSVTQFLTCDANRAKRVVPDLGSIIIKMFLSNHNYEECSNEIFYEFFARQIYWIEKKDNRVIERIPQKDLVEVSFEHTKRSNQLFVLKVLAAKWFIREDKIAKIDENVGFLPVNVINDFKNVICRIKEIKNYPSMLNALSMSSLINSKTNMIQFIYNCKQLAREQRYLNWY